MSPGTKAYYPVSRHKGASAPAPLRRIANFEIKKSAPATIPVSNGRFEAAATPRSDEGRMNGSVRLEPKDPPPAGATKSASPEFPRDLP